jgi:predicted nuclease with TOPRIM domain
MSIQEAIDNLLIIDSAAGLEAEKKLEELENKAVELEELQERFDALDESNDRLIEALEDIQSITKGYC